MGWSPPPTDQQCKEAFQAFETFPSKRQAAASVGLSVFGLKHRVKLYHDRGLAGGSKAADPPIDVTERHRLNSEITRLRHVCSSLTERLTAAEDHRSSILGLPATPAEPMARPRAVKASKHGAQAVVIHLSDLHVGEVVNRDEVMGVNEYTLKIAQNRIGRLFNTVSILTTTAWPASDPPPVRLVVLLGGDLISGHGLHPEHAETDAGTAYQQTKWASDAIATGIARLCVDLKAHYGKPIPVDIISVGGNHGRMTFGKPRSKLVSLQNYDTLVADFVEAGLREYPAVTHSRPRGFDAYFDVVGWPCLLTHGDRMGSGGGTGFIGPMAAIIKGHRKIIDTEHRQRRPVRWVFSGHFHTTGVTPFGFGNGSGVGYGEFAKSLRADPEPAQQNMVVFHERIGVLRWHPIAMGDPAEGSIYQPTASPILPERP